jgi:hypothetical protein
MTQPATMTARTIALAFVLLAAVALAFVSGLLTPDVTRTNAQQPAVFAIDADPSGNTPTSIGAIDECATVSKGPFSVDVVVANVDGLLAWESLLSYDKNILRITEVDVRHFLAADPGSSVVNVSASLPNSTGSFYMGAGDVGGERDSGDGVLARLTLEASNSGVSHLILATRDVDGNGTADLGPTLSGLTIADQVIHIGDADGDEMFDDPTNARVAVDVPCPAPTPTPTPTPAPGPGDGPPAPDDINDSIREGIDALREADTAVDGVTGDGGGDGSGDAVFVPGSGDSDSSDDGAPGRGASGNDNGDPGGSGIDIGRSGGDGDWPMWLITLIVGAPLAFGGGLLALWRFRGPGL